MQNVKKETFERKCRDGEWECEFEPNAFGTAQVRVTATGRRRQVRVGR